MSVNQGFKGLRAFKMKAYNKQIKFIKKIYKKN